MSLRALNTILMNTSAIMHTMTVPVPAPTYQRPEEVSLWDYLGVEAGAGKLYDPALATGPEVTYVTREVYETIAEHAPHELWRFAITPEVET